MESEIKTCFCLYLNHIKSNIKNVHDYDVSKMTISQIKSQLNIIHMQYILTSSSYAVSEASPCVVAYKHLKKMIDVDDNNSKYEKFESDIKILNLENAILKQELNDLKNKISNTLFPNLSTSLNMDANANADTNTNVNQSKGWFS